MKTIEDLLRERPGDAEVRAAHASRMRAEGRGHRLEELREAYGIAVSELSDTSGLLPEDVVEIERGRVDHLPVDLLRRYAEGLGATLRVEVEVADVRHRVA
jgi:transcriptional regulator with XRE-family HTH domain